MAGINDVLYDPVFQDLVRKHELSVRRLREDVQRLRSYYLSHHKRPAEDSVSERWMAATLQNAAADRLEDVRESAADLLRYGFELAPFASDDDHMAAISAAKAAHMKRLEERTGWGKRPIFPKGPEEQIKVDDGPPLTFILKPEEPPAEGSGQ